ncbi:gfo/Idh/MocA family oxidoreductase [Chitinophaga oryziterrae]|uniref:Gfo/Idh/MocA family oxidoreductase n=1 Tax=Chitinophaga oryziterrae TaxID=1031224 RepID=A0A6N8J3I2_9BACT|nr:Gfo/Idh/MocA family oxidoreductase [Chitinophaga oryziterrae]MVT39730.1 gfo/Idh/MocA family oxidoreductase [Chitinophaga oryziterrae]
MNVLFIGYGSIAAKHKQALDNLYPDAICYALRSHAGSAPVAGVVNIYGWEELAEKVDFAIVSTPTFRHTEYVKILTEKGIPVFLEKPIASVLDDLDILDQQISQWKLPTYVACNLRFLPVLQFLHAYISDERPRINEVLVYAGSYLPDWRPKIDFRENYSARADMGGGVHLDLFHELDYISWLFGLPSRSISIKTSASSLEISAVDFASFSWVYNGFTATILLNYFRRKAKRTIDIVFEDDTWIVDLMNNRIIAESGKVVFDQPDFSIKDTYTKQMAYFTDCISKNVTPLLNTFGNSLKILKICLQEDEIKR